MENKKIVAPAGVDVKSFMEGGLRIPEGYKGVIEDGVFRLVKQESEDERTRKEIYGFLNRVLKDKNVLLLVADRIGDNIPSMIPSWIAYLEKQEEQKPIVLDEDTQLGIDRAIQIVCSAKGKLYGYQSDDGIYECDHAIRVLKNILENGVEQQPAE